MSTQCDRAEVDVYPDHLLPQLQHALTLLADLQARYEIQRESLESWPGWSVRREQLLAELEQAHRANLNRLEACLSGLRLGSRGGAAKSEI